MLTKVLLYTYDYQSKSYILKCTVPLNNQEDTIDCIKRPYSYMVRRTNKEFIGRLVVEDFTGEIILGIDTISKYYYNNINSAKYTQLYNFVKREFYVLNNIGYIERELEW